MWTIVSLLLVLMFSVEWCLLQKPNTDSNRRHDVYIAGFFPYGRGVENSETGCTKEKKIKIEIFFIFDFKVEELCLVLNSLWIM